MNEEHRLKYTDESYGYDMNIEISVNRDLKANDLLQLYEANKWSAADKPELLIKALLNSHSLVTAWDGTTLVGLGNAISDGYLVDYYPHLLVPTLLSRQRCWAFDYG